MRRSFTFFTFSVGVAFFFDDPEASNPDFRAVITERQIDIDNEGHLQKQIESRSVLQHLDAAMM